MSIKKLVKKLVVPPQKPESPPEINRYSNGLDFELPFERSLQRRSIEKDIDNMDKNDGIIARAFDSISNFASCWDLSSEFGFDVELKNTGDPISTKDKQALELLKETSNLPGIQGIDCWETIRMMVKYGNVFSEIVYEEEAVKKVVTFSDGWQISKNLNKDKTLKSGDPAAAFLNAEGEENAAFVQRDYAGNVVAAFWPFQISHYMFGTSEFNAYAEPLLGCFIKDWKKLRAQEDSLAVTRITRTWDSNVHEILVPAGSKEKDVREKVEEYRRMILEDSLTTYDTKSSGLQSTFKANPMDVNKDYFLVKYYDSNGNTVSGGISKLAPSTAALDNINDIYWMVARLFAAIGVPMDYIGIKVGQRAFVDKTTEKGIEAFSKFIKRLQACHAYGTKKIFDIQLLLHGFDPRLEYLLVYPNIVPQSAEVLTKVELNKAMTSKYWLEIGLPVELVGKNVLDLNPDEVAMWAANLKKGVKGE